MAQTMQEQKRAAKSKSTAMNQSSHVPTSSSSAKSLIASKSPGILIAVGKSEIRMRRNSKSDAASSSQAQLEDAYLGALMDTATGEPVATKEESGDVDLSESETESEEDLTGKPVACKTATGKPYASSKSDCHGGPKAEKIQCKKAHRWVPARRTTVHRCPPTTRSTVRQHNQKTDTTVFNNIQKVMLIGLLLDSCTKKKKYHMVRTSRMNGIRDVIGHNSGRCILSLPQSSTHPTRRRCWVSCQM